MAGPGKKQGAVAFAAGVVAAPLIGAAAVAFVVGVGLIWYASSRDRGLEPADDVAFGFAEPDDIQATEVEKQQRRPRRARARPAPSPRSGDRSTSSSSSRGSGSSGSSGSSSSASPPPSAPSGGTDHIPAMPVPPELRNDEEGGSLRPGAVPTEQADVVDVREARAARSGGPSDDDNPFAPPVVAAAEPEEPVTRTRKSAEPGPHEFPEDDGPSWIPDTFRNVVEGGIALLTGEAGEPAADATPAMPDADPDAPQATRTAAAPGPDGLAPTRTRTSSKPTPSPATDDGVSDVGAPASAPDTPLGPGATPRGEDAPPITPTGADEPDASVVPAASAMPTTAPGEAPAFAPPAPEPVPGTTLDGLIAGGMDLVTGKGAPVVEAPQPVRTRTKMEEDVAEYTDPVDQDFGAAIELEEEDLSLDLEEHDAAASFGTPAVEEDVDITEALDLEDIVIPVKIQTATPGVPVQIDGKDLGVSPARSDLADGDHTVVVGSGADATTFTIAPMANPDVWCFDTKSSGGYRQVPCD